MHRWTMFATAAFSYAEQGIPVFPVSVRGKVPFKGSKGFLEATTDLQVIEAWWKRWPQANIAVPTGSASGWVVLDIDGRHGGLESFKLLKAMLEHRAIDLGHPLDRYRFPKTRRGRTGSGYHLVFALPNQQEEGYLPHNMVEVAGLSGLDLRGEGGYVVVPPSRHPSGRRYRWELEIEPVAFPPALIELLQWRETRATREHQQQALLLEQRRLQETPLPGEIAQWSNPNYWLDRALQRAQVGMRHRCALWLACRLIEHARLSPQEAKPYMQCYAESVPGEDFSVSEALACLKWAAQRLTFDTG